MSGGNQQQTQSAPVDPQQAQKEAAEKAQQEARDREREQYERNAEDYRLFTGFKKSDWRRINKSINDKDDDVPDGPAISTADTSSGLILPGVWRRGQSPGHPATEFDVRVDPNGSVHACYKKKYQYGVLGWIKLLSDKQWDQAQGEVLDMMAAGRGVKAVTLNWESPEHVTEKYVMRYLELAQARGLTVNFGSSVETWLDNQSQSVRDKVYQKRLAVEKNADKVQSERSIIGKEGHEFKQYSNALNDPNKAPKLDDPLKKQSVEKELPDVKKQRYEASVNKDLAGKSTLQEKSELLDKELKAVESRLSHLHAAKNALVDQVNNISGIGGIDRTTPEGQKAFDLAEKRQQKCEVQRNELLKAIKAETDDLKLRMEVLKRMSDNKELTDPLKATEARKTVLASEKTALETEKARLEAVLSPAKDTPEHKAAVTKNEKDIADNTKNIADNEKEISSYNAAKARQPELAQRKVALEAEKARLEALPAATKETPAHKADVTKNEKDIADNTKNIADNEKVISPYKDAQSKSNDLDNRLRLIDQGRPAPPAPAPGQPEGPPKVISLQALEKNNSELKAVVANAKAQQPQAHAGPGAP